MNWPKRVADSGTPRSKVADVRRPDAGVLDGRMTWIDGFPYVVSAIWRKNEGNNSPLRESRFVQPIQCGYVRLDLRWIFRTQPQEVAIPTPSFDMRYWRQEE